MKGLSELQKSQITDEQVFTLYKVLTTPEDTMMRYLLSLDRNALKKAFRKYTLLLHPDKNGHHDSKRAFQKIYSIIKPLLG